MAPGHLLGRIGALLLLGLAGCAGLPVAVAPETLAGRTPVEHFELDGRLAVQTADQHLSGSLTWRRLAGEETLLMSGPLGQGAVEIRRQGGRLTLKGADGEEISEDSDERLMERALGLRLPLDGLVWWLSALPRPGQPFRAAADADGHVARLDQDGWHIEYSRYQLRGDRWLPGRLFASRGEIEFRLVVDNWVTP
ncbi:outer membrane lipoprotein LolB [Parasulfuritortus cantonensis]|uniref:Outer-membrane lipoprotein LolB n=1 Tax=Parasulfuritortus cantonensis TaxID=2528202 RepID=A0A4R1B7A9_9PROT|nr:lipoprotein insertase outer membrane protein LolB [Parasulfuritortus cantonensis]TCJ12388.1 outer membrane lipoprotein LolB [Parasulfuritortus cantonensis]